MRVVVVSNAPTPYEDDLFEALHERRELMVAFASTVERSAAGASELATHGRTGLVHDSGDSTGWVK